MANRFINPVTQFVDLNGDPIEGGTLQFYQTGGTTTLLNTYSNSTLTVPNLSTITLNNEGRPDVEIFLDPAVTYRLVIKYADGSVFETLDPVVDHAANAMAAFQVYNGDPNGNVAGNAGTVGGAGASAVWDKTNKLLWICTTTGSAAAAVWEAIGSRLAGSVSMSGIITPSALSADANDYSPTDLSISSVIRQDSSLDVKISGLAGGSQGRLMQYRNISIYKQTLLSESALSAAANRFNFEADLVLLPEQSVWLWYDVALQNWCQVGDFFNAPTGDPGGRLTLESGVPVSTSDQTAKTTIFYAPYRHNYARLYNGKSWYVVQFSELSQTLADATKSPAAAATNSIYDVFLWNDAGTLRISRGPTWATGGGSSSARGAGAGSTEIERVNGTYLNKYDITNGPAAQRGLYLGTISTDGTGANGQMNMMFAPAAAAGGTANRLDVWNNYNRLKVAAMSRDSTNTWTYGTTTWRSANNSTSNRVTFVRGLNEDVIEVVNRAPKSTANSQTTRTGIGLDSTSAFSGTPDFDTHTSGASSPQDESFHASTYDGYPGSGSHFVQALEWSSSLTNVFYGDNGDATLIQQALIFKAMM